MPRPIFTPGKYSVPVVQEAGWAPGLVWTGAENLAPTGIRSPDRPTRSQSLYRLRYPAHEHERNGREILFLIEGIFISVEKLTQLQCISSLVSCANNHNARKFTSKPSIGLIGLFIRNRLKFMFILRKLLQQAIYCIRCSKIKISNLPTRFIRMFVRFLQ